MNGSSSNGNIRFSDVPHGRMGLFVSHLPVEGEPTLFDAAVIGTARGNPLKPDISLPVSIAELRDLPRMLWNRPKGRSRNSVVESEFGWQPLLVDAKKLFTFPSLVEQRLSMLKHMKSKGGLTRQRSAFSGNAQVITKNVLVFSSFGLRLYGTEIHNTQKGIRVTAKWSPLEDFSSIGNEQMASLARNLVLGLDHRQFGAQAWDLLPWSWLVDWFSNYGDWLSIYSGGISIAPTSCCVSTVYESSVGWTRTGGTNWLSCSPSQIQRRYWSRSVNVPILPGARLPALSSRQSLILASIASNMRRNG
jgi:hypothetical protein